jgi:hypothetical protein
MFNRHSVVLAAVLAIGIGTRMLAQPAVDQVSVPFSDPSKPGLIKVDLVQGHITVRGSDRKDVLVTARGRGESRTRAADASGLRRIPQVAGFKIVEDFNEMSIEAENPSRAIDFEILAPTRSHLMLATVNSGNIVVEAIDGNLEIQNTNGGITLTGVSGSVVANTTNGNVIATMLRVTAQKAMAFTSLNGRVDVTLPAATRANLKLRSDNGDVYTDFDLALKPAETPTVYDGSRRGGRLQISVNKSVYGSINGGGPDIEMRTFNSSVYVRKGQ